MTTILSRTQAGVIYSAMCELNNINGKIDVTLAGGIRVYESVAEEGVLVRQSFPPPMSGQTIFEGYESQAEFANAYDLDGAARVNDEINIVGGTVLTRAEYLAQRAPDIDPEQARAEGA
ncbi:MAG: hypothetical protein WDN30_14360 [Pararobbsia sp.]